VTPLILEMGTAWGLLKKKLALSDSTHTLINQQDATTFVITNKMYVRHAASINKILHETNMHMHMQMYAYESWKSLH
jgi:hypothetical protein